MKTLFYLNLLILFYVAMSFLVPAAPEIKSIVVDRPETLRIAIIDTGYDRFDFDYKGADLKLCASGHYDYSTSMPQVGSTFRHGTAVGHIIANELKGVDYCAIIYTIPYYTDGKEVWLGNNEILKAVKAAQLQNVVAVNLSLGGEKAGNGEREALEELAKTARLFMAGGNKFQDLNTKCNYFPACYYLQNSVSVGGVFPGTNQIAPYSNYNGPITAWADGTTPWENYEIHGTSLAVPRVLSDYVLRLARLQRLATNQQSQ